MYTHTPTKGLYRSYLLHEIQQTSGFPSNREIFSPMIGEDGVRIRLSTDLPLCVCFISEIRGQDRKESDIRLILGKEHGCGWQYKLRQYFLQKTYRACAWGSRTETNSEATCENQLSVGRPICAAAPEQGNWGWIQAVVVVNRIECCPTVWEESWWEGFRRHLTYMPKRLGNLSAVLGDGGSNSGKREIYFSQDFSATSSFVHSHQGNNDA